MSNIANMSGTGNGLQATAAAMQRAAQRFDAAAAEVVSAADANQPSPVPATSPDAPAEAAPDLAEASVHLSDERFVNQILFETYRAQARQQESLSRLQA